MRYKILAESLREAARKIGKTTDFWNLMSEKIMKGQINGINPELHLKPVPDTDRLCHKIHSIIGEPGRHFNTLKPEVRATYLELVRAILEEL